MLYMAQMYEITKQVFLGEIDIVAIHLRMETTIHRIAREMAEPWRVHVFVHLLIFILFALFVCLFVYYYYYYYSIVIIIGYNYHRWPAVIELPFWQSAVV